MPPQITLHNAVHSSDSECRPLKWPIFCITLQIIFPKVDVCAVHERDSVKSGPCGRYGSTLGNRGLRWHEESLHGECEKYFLVLTLQLLFQVEMYNPEEDSWSFVASMESHEGGVGVGVIPMVWVNSTWSQWWSRWSESTTIVHFVPMIPLIRMIPLVNKPHRRTAQLYPPYQWNPISGTASQLCIFSCKLSVIHNFEPSPLKFGPQNKSCQNQNELFSEFCLLENCCKT